MSQYSVLVVGMGKRGMPHGAAFNANPKFQVTGICDARPERHHSSAWNVSSLEVSDLRFVRGCVMFRPESTVNPRAFSQS